MIKDTIFIDNLTIPARIGVYEWEQRITQQLLVSLTVETSFAAAVQQDSIDDTLSYAWLAEVLVKRVQSTQHALLETLIAELGDWLVTLERIQAFELTIRKPGAVAGAESVGVRRAWQRSA